MSKTRSATGPRAIVPIDLALQGGGSHGAFTWGVLDRLLEVPWLRVDGISGTSAGAMNAVVLVDGHLKGGAEGTKEALSTFRRKVSDAALLSPFRRSLLDMLTGRGKVSGNAELSTQVLLASACVPTLLQAVEIDGDPYWDGGYAGNPTISPLVRECDANDIVLVQINPVQRPGVPRSAREIHNRLNEVSFNSPLLKELRMIALLRQVTDPGHAEGALWARMRMHRIATDAMLELGYSSKMIAEWPFLCHLRDEGRRAADAFLQAHGSDLGTRPSLDLDGLLEGV